jgi:hypothetical protein
MHAPLTRLQVHESRGSALPQRIGAADIKSSSARLAFKFLRDTDALGLRPFHLHLGRDDGRMYAIVHEGHN